MECPLKNGLECPMEDVYGACFFCTKVDERYDVSKVPVLETDDLFD